MALRHTSPKKKEPKTMPAACKTMGTVFWDAKGCILVRILPQGGTINAAHYLQTLHKLHCALRDKCPGKKISCNNAQSHTVFLCVQRIQKNGWEFLPHPSYSLDLTPSDKHLFFGFQRIRCKASTMQPRRQSRKLSIILHELLKQEFY